MVWVLSRLLSSQVIKEKIMISFSKRIFFLSVFIFLSATASAQGQKIEEGFDYRVLPVSQPVETKGKV